MDYTVLLDQEDHEFIAAFSASWDYMLTGMINPNTIFNDRMVLNPAIELTRSEAAHGKVARTTMWLIPVRFNPDLPKIELRRVGIMIYYRLNF